MLILFSASACLAAAVLSIPWRSFTFLVEHLSIFVVLFARKVNLPLGLSFFREQGTQVANSK